MAESFLRLSLLSAGSARNTKPPAIELPPISRVQEMGDSSSAGVDIDGSYLRKDLS